MKKIFVLFLFSLLFGCATSQKVYDPQTGRFTRSVDVNTSTPAAVGINTAGGAALGCVAGGLLGVAAGDAVGGCALGAVAGGIAGAASTQEETYVVQNQQGYASRAQSHCTGEYNSSLQEINATVALRRQEAANYLTTGDREGAQRLEQGIIAWQTNSTAAIQIRYQNCISQLTPGSQQYDQGQYAPQIQAYSSRPVIQFPPIQIFSVPRYYGYQYPYYYRPHHHYRQYYGGYYGGGGPSAKDLYFQQQPPWVQQRHECTQYGGPACWGRR